MNPHPTCAFFKIADPDFPSAALPLFIISDCRADPSFAGISVFSCVTETKHEDQTKHHVNIFQLYRLITCWRYITCIPGFDKCLGPLLGLTEARERSGNSSSSYGQDDITHTHKSGQIRKQWNNNTLKHARLLKPDILWHWVIHNIMIKLLTSNLGGFCCINTIRWVSCSTSPHTDLDFFFFFLFFFAVCSASGWQDSSWRENIILWLISMLSICTCKLFLIIGKNASDLRGCVLCGRTLLHDFRRLRGNAGPGCCWWSIRVW